MWDKCLKGELLHKKEILKRRYRLEIIVQIPKYFIYNFYVLKLSIYLNLDNKDITWRKKFSHYDLKKKPGNKTLSQHFKIPEAKFIHLFGFQQATALSPAGLRKLT